MRVAILSRPGDCFPNIISLGLREMLKELDVESRIFYDSIPFLMRLLPLGEKPKRWSNSFHFRVRNKVSHRKADRQLIEELRKYDIIILSECLPNAFWKNYLAIERLRELVQAPVVCYLDAYLDNAPIHQKMWLDGEDHGSGRYDFHLCPSPVTELRGQDRGNWRSIGVNISLSGLTPKPKGEFTALVDFRQKGYEAYREQQLRVLEKLGIRTIVLEGRYKIEDIRALYQAASVFFMAFPETFGLPIAECLACGTAVFTPESGWPMAWRLNAAPMPWGSGTLPECFKVYSDEDHLTRLLTEMRDSYDAEKTPLKIFESFNRHYPALYKGDPAALKSVLDRLVNR